MQTRDHKVLAEFLVSKMGQELSVIYIKAFILGNIEPDKNLFTYLHGWVRGVKFHGHNYENILPVMDKLFGSLRGKRHWGVSEYYHFGKLMHYIADAFTLPHNGIFKGNLREHCRYILKAAVMLAQEVIGTFWKIDFNRCEKGSRVIRLGNELYESSSCVSGS